MKQGRTYFKILYHANDVTNLLAPSSRHSKNHETEWITNKETMKK